MTKVFKRHVLSLIIRVILLCIAIFIYATNPSRLDFTTIDTGNVFLFILWVLLAVGMLFRIFPNRYVAMGARKHSPLNTTDSSRQNQPSPNLHRGTVGIVLFWISLNSLITVGLHLLGILNPATSIIFVLLYAISDLVFILFYCPFQKIFMRNRCCVTCRIYNWDYFMMCTPMLIFPSVFSLSLIFLALVVLVRWEIAVYKNPHYFAPQTNEQLRCANCTDKTCLLKKI